MIHKKHIYLFIISCLSNGLLSSSANDWICTEYSFNNNANKMTRVTTPSITDDTLTEEPTSLLLYPDTTLAQPSIMPPSQMQHPTALRTTSAKRQRTNGPNDLPQDKPNRRSRTNNGIKFMRPATSITEMNKNLEKKILNKEKLNVDPTAITCPSFFKSDDTKAASLPLIAFPTATSTHTPSTSSTASSTHAQSKRRFVNILPNFLAQTFSIQAQPTTGLKDFIPLPQMPNTITLECTEKLPPVSSLIPNHRPQTFDSTHDLPLEPVESLFNSIQVLPDFSHLKPLGHILPRCSSLLSALNQYEKTKSPSHI